MQWRKETKRTKGQTMNFMNQGYSRIGSCALTFLIFYNKSLDRKLKNLGAPEGQAVSASPVTKNRYQIVITTQQFTNDLIIIKGLMAFIFQKATTKNINTQTGKTIK